MACWPRIASFAGEVLVPGADRRTLYVVRGAEITRSISLPFLLPEWGLQWAAVADGTLHVVADDGSVRRTTDLTVWEAECTSSHSLITIAFWAERRWLVVGGVGPSAGVWKIELDP